MRSKIRIASLALLVTLVWVGGIYLIVREFIKDDVDPFLNKIWVLDSIEGESESVAPRHADDFSLIFVDDRWVIGDDGCNFFAGIFSRDQEVIGIRDLIQSENTCAGSDEARIETLGDLLLSAREYSLDEQTLHIQTENRTLHFSSRGSRGGFQLERNTWQLVWIGSGFGVEPSYFVDDMFNRNRESTLILETSQISIHSGCNQLFGPYTISGDDETLYTEGIGSTLMWCGPQAVMDQEERLSEFFTHSELTVRIFDNLLILSKEGQMMVFVAVG